MSNSWGVFRLKINGWKMHFLFGNALRGHVSFRECTYPSEVLTNEWMPKMLGELKDISTDSKMVLLSIYGKCQGGNWK